MTIKSTGSFLLIWMSIIVALVLSIMKLPASLSDYLPNYACLVVLVWVVAIPSRVNVFTGWITGLCMDFLLGTTLGIHALAFSFMVWMIRTQFDSIKYYSLPELSIVVGTVIFIGQFVLFWGEHLFGVVTVDYNIFWSALSSSICWPIIYVFFFFLYHLISPKKEDE